MPHPLAPSLVILDPRALDGKCLALGFVSCGIDLAVAHFADLADWQQASGAVPPPAAVLLNIRSRKIGEPSVNEEIKAAVAAFAPAPVILLADGDEIAQVKLALDCGVTGYVPSSVGIEVCLKIIDLVRSGGTYIPASSLRGTQLAVELQPSATLSPTVRLTSRQALVAEPLRRGKTNKIIADELNMCESTVKVHIHNIMKKLKAKNRTEVAYKLESFKGET